MKIFMAVLLLLSVSKVALAQASNHRQRWEVKTRMDTVPLHAGLDSTSVILQRSLYKPDWGRKARWTHAHRQEDEKGTLILCGNVVKIGLEPDGDYHLVLADTCCKDSTMTIEIPDPDSSTSSEFIESYRKARLMVDTLWKQALSKGHLKSVAPMRVVIVGLGFWDKTHGPKTNDAAPNGREIHPVLEVRRCE